MSFQRNDNNIGPVLFVGLFTFTNLNPPQPISTNFNLPEKNTKLNPLQPTSMKFNLPQPTSTYFNPPLPKFDNL